MAELIVLDEDGPLGKAGDKVWVDDKPEPEKAPAKAAHPKKKS